MHASITGAGYEVAALMQTPQQTAAQARAEAAAARADAQATQAQIKAEIQDAIRATRDAVRDATQEGGEARVQFPVPPVPPGVTSTAAPDLSNLIPPRAVDIVSITGLTLVCCVVGFPIARAIGRWIDRRGTSPNVPREVTNRLAAIEQAVESIAVEVERVSEGQRYTTRLLSGGAHDAPPDFLGAHREAVPASSVPASSVPGNPAGNTPANARRS